MESYNEIISLKLLHPNEEKNRARYEICSKLTVKTPERRYSLGPGVFIVNFE